VTNDKLKRKYIGCKSGRLTVTGISKKRASNGSVFLECSCFCGESYIGSAASFNSGNVRSCGCLKNDHGKLSKEDKSKAFTMYQSGDYTFQQLSEIFSISRVAMGGIIKRRGGIAKKQSMLQRKYQINEDYFDSIGEKQAYILGLLMADGYNNTSKYEVSLQLVDKDIIILNIINKLLGTDKPLRIIPSKTAIWFNIKEYTSRVSYRLVIESKKLSKRIADLGVVKNKTHVTKYPYWLDNNMHKHYIRGYMDGDGWIGQRAMSFIGTSDFLEGASEIIVGHTGVSTTMRLCNPERNNTITELSISGKVQVKKVLDWLYTGHSISLPRKNKRYKSTYKFHNPYQKRYAEWS